MTLTEADLRTALVDRADQDRIAIEAAADAIADRLTHLSVAAEPRSRYRRVAVVAATLATAAAVTIPIALARSGSDAEPGPNPPSAVVPPANDSAPVPHQTSTPLPLPSQVANPAVVNEVHVAIDRPVLHDQRTDAEYLTVQLPGGKHAQVSAFAPSVGFGASRVADAVPIQIGSAAGLYGRVSVWPANGRPDPATHKQDGAIASVVWQLPDGTWVVVSNDDPYAPASALVPVAQSLLVSLDPAPVRVPFTLGALPRDFALSYVEWESNGPGITDVVVGLTSARGLVGIMLSANGPDGGYASETVAYRQVGTAWLAGTATKDDTATVQSILDGIEVVSNPFTPSDAWPLLSEAVR